MNKYLLYHAQGLGLKWLYETRAQAEAHARTAPDIDYRIMTVPAEEAARIEEDCVTAH